MANNNDKYKNHSREELIDELEILKKKKYGLVWDKKNSQEILDAFVNWENMPENFTPKQFPVLKEVKNKEIEMDKNKPVNLLIEGDNYHSLAVLNFTHQNKVDLIYIDPPYNTGNKDFIYNDKFVENDDPFRHSKWLSFMEKRLRLSHKLLKPSGVIFISIDDNEFAQLKMLCDEVFGEDNFITNIIVKMSHLSGVKMSHLDKKLPKLKEYILMYAKSKHSLKVLPIYEQVLWDKAFSRYKSFLIVDEKDSLNYKKWSVIPLRTAIQNAGIDLDDKNEVTKFCFSNANKIFRTARNRSSLFLDLPNDENFREIITTSGLKKIAYKREEVLFASTKLKISENGELFAFEPLGDLWIDIGINNLHNEGGVAFRNGKKPLKLIKRLISMCPNESGVILDFMAGSGTTGHAVLELNEEDKGNKKFILCTNNEEIDGNGQKIKHKICSDICYPRLNNVIRGYKNQNNENNKGLGGNLKYFKTDFVGSDSTDKNKRDLVNKSAEMICIKEDIFDLIANGGLDYRIYQKGKKFLGVIFDIDAIANFKKEAEKHKGNFAVYCFSYTEATPEKEFKGLKNKYVLKPIPALILKIYLEIFKK